jgi:simple sugar transport system permease protein
MAICGGFAGMAASMDVLGWQFQLSTNDIQGSQTGFLGIAVALLGRNTALGTVLAALLFGALETGTSVRNLNPNIFDPQLAGNLTLMIEGLVVLLVSTDLIAIRLLGLPAKLKFGRADAVPAPATLDLPGQGATDESPAPAGRDAAAELPEDGRTGAPTVGL